MFVIVCVACWSSGNRRWGVLVPKSNWQIAGGEVTCSAYRTSQVPKARLPREGKL